MPIMRAPLKMRFLLRKRRALARSAKKLFRVLCAVPVVCLYPLRGLGNKARRTLSRVHDRAQRREFAHAAAQKHIPTAPAGVRNFDAPALRRTVTRRLPCGTERSIRKPQVYPESA
jgi:hypothetical protein